MRRLFTSFWIVALGRGLQIILGMVSLRVLSTYLPSQELGYYYLITAIVSWFGLVMMNPVGMYANRKANEWHKQNRLGIAGLALFLYTLALATISVPIVFALDKTFDFSNHGSTALLVLSVFLQVAVTSLGATFLSQLNLTSSRQVYVPIAVLVQFLGIFAAVVLVKTMVSAAWLWLLGIALSNVVAIGIAIFIFTRGHRQRKSVSLGAFVRPQVKDLKAFVGPVLFATLLMWAQSQGYRFFVESWLGRDSLARLSIGLGAALSIFASAEGFVTQYFFPELYRSMDSPDMASKKNTWDKLIDQIFTSYFLIFFACWVAAPYILHILLAPQYQDLTIIFSLGVALELCRVMTNIVYLGTHSEWDPRKSITSYSIGVVTVLIGLTIQYLSGDENLIWTAATLAIGSIVTFATMWLQVRRLMSLQLPWRQALTAGILMAPLFLLRFRASSTWPEIMFDLGIIGIWTLVLLLRVQKGLRFRFKEWANRR